MTVSLEERLTLLAWICVCVCVCVCVVTQSPWFVLPWPEATWVLVLGKKCMLLLQLVLWKEKKKKQMCTDSANLPTVTVLFYISQKICFITYL